MRILLVSPLPPPEGGIAIWTKQYLAYCQENNIDVSIVNIALTGKRSNKINDKRNLFDEVKRTFSIISDLKKKIRDFKPEYVHINSACAQFGLIRDAMCVSIAKRLNTKVVLHFRCTVEDKLGESSLRKKLFRKITNNSDLILTLNTVSEKFVKDNIPCSKVVTVPNFITVNDECAEHKINDDVKTILYVGHVQFDKGAREILEVAKRFADKNFVLAGPVAEEVKALQCPSNVKLLGRVEHNEVKNLMNNADVFLFPSYTEGFSNALVEAMTYGLPVVATDVGANRDMIENKGGFIVPPKEYEGLVDALKKLEDRKLRTSMSLWNQRKVIEKYKLETVMQQLLSIYSSI